MIDPKDPLYLQQWFVYLDEAESLGMKIEDALEYAEQKTIEFYSYKDTPNANH